MNSQIAPTPIGVERNGPSAERVFNKARSSFIDMTQRHRKKYYLIAILSIMFIFGVIFVACMWLYPSSWVINNPSSSKLVDGVYYWGTVTSTIGFGDIVPATAWMKVWTVSYQLFITFVSIGGAMYLAQRRDY